MTALGVAAVWLLLAPLARADAAGVLERVTRRGPVEVAVRLEPATPRIGDALQLEIEALAEEGVELLMPEFGEALDRFLIVDFAPSEELAADGRTRAVQRYTLQPPMSGRHAIPPLLVEFVDRRPGARAAPEGADAYEVLTERLDFEVDSVLPEGVVPELRPPPGELAAVDRGPLPAWGWAVIALSALALAGGAAFRIYTAPRRRRRSAWEIARAELDSMLARARPGPEELDAFYVELSGLIRRYVERRFELRSPELTTEEFLEVAGRSPGLERPQRDRLLDFLRGADLVKFARHRPGGQEVEAALASAADFISKTRATADRVPPGGAVPADAGAERAHG